MKHFTLFAFLIFSTELQAACSSACEQFKQQIITSSDGTRTTIESYNQVRLNQKKEISIYKKIQAEEALTPEEESQLLLKRGRREFLYTGINAYLGHGSTLLGFLRWAGVDIDSNDMVRDLPFNESEELRENYYNNLYEVQNLEDTKDIFGDLKNNLYSFIEQIFPYGVADASGDDPVIHYLGDHTKEVICNEKYLKSLMVTALDFNGTETIDPSSADFADQLAEARTYCLSLSDEILKYYHLSHYVDKNEIVIDYKGASRGDSNPALNAALINPLNVDYSDDFKNNFNVKLDELKDFSNVALLDYENAFCHLLAPMSGDYNTEGVDPFGDPLCEFGVNEEGVPEATPSSVNETYQTRYALSKVDINGVVDFGNKILDLDANNNDIRNSNLNANLYLDIVEDVNFALSENLEASDKDLIGSLVESQTGSPLSSSDIDEDVWLKIKASPEGRVTAGVSHFRGQNFYEDKFELGVDFLEFNFPPYKLRENDLFVLDFPINELDSAFSVTAPLGGSLIVFENDGTANDDTLANRLGRIDMSEFDIKFVTNTDDIRSLTPEARKNANVEVKDYQISALTFDIEVDKLPESTVGEINTALGTTADPVVATARLSLDHTERTSYVLGHADCQVNSSDAKVSNLLGGVPGDFNISYRLSVLDADDHTPRDVGNGPVILDDTINFYAANDAGTQCLQDYANSNIEDLQTEFTQQMTPPE